MATVSSIDNQFPLLQAGGEKSSISESESIIPFGQWLQQKSEIKDEPMPIKFKQSEHSGQENNTAEKIEQKGTKLFAEEPLSKAKTSKGLFKEKHVADKGAKGGIKTAGLPIGQKAATKKAAAQKPAAQKPAANPDQETAKQAISRRVQAGYTKVPVQTSGLKGSGSTVNTGTQQKTGSLQKAAMPVQSTPGANLRSSSPVPSQPGGADSLTQLKTNVKAIFNSLTHLKTSTPSGTTVARVNAQPVANTRTVSIDNVKPIRLTTLPVAQQSTLQGGKTTIQHLKARKNAKLDPQTLLNKKGGQQSTDTVDKGEVSKSIVKNKALAGEGNVQNAGKKGSARVSAKDSIIGKKTRARRRKNAKSGKYVISNKNNAPQIAASESYQKTAADADAVKGNQLLQNAANQLKQTDFAQTDGASSESNLNNLPGRGETGLKVSTGKQTGKATRAFAGRSLSWLKALSERTAQMNRRDPHWKMLEMKLDKGDGHMTIKVMREDEHVSISVQFTDDVLRTHAESQANQILESLKEQYGKDVTFSFADQKESELNSSLSNMEARRRRLNRNTEEAENPVPVQRYNPLAPDQHLWIG